MIVLIRHGQTEANQKHLYCGSTDLPLAPEGREALQSLRYAFPDVRCITSGMRRTNETLSILFGDVPFEVREGFREIDFGAFEMHSYDELKEDPSYLAWISGDNEANVPPNGESGVQMKNRVLAAYAALTAEKRDTVLVTHGGVIAVIMEHLFPEAGKNRYQWQPKPGHGYIIREKTYEAI